MSRQLEITGNKVDMHDSTDEVITGSFRQQKQHQLHVPIWQQPCHNPTSSEITTLCPDKNVHSITAVTTTVSINSHGSVLIIQLTGDENTRSCLRSNMPASVTFVALSDVNARDMTFSRNMLSASQRREVRSWQRHHQLQSRILLSSQHQSPVSTSSYNR